MIGAPVWLQVHVVDGQMTITPTTPMPTVGAKLADTESIALCLLNAGKAIGCRVDYTPANVGPYALCKALLDPEDLGYSATAEIRDRARWAMGLPAAEYFVKARVTN